MWSRRRAQWRLDVVDDARWLPLLMVVALSHLWAVGNLRCCGTWARYQGVYRDRDRAPINKDNTLTAPPPLFVFLAY